MPETTFPVAMRMLEYYSATELLLELQRALCRSQHQQRIDHRQVDAFEESASFNLVQTLQDADVARRNRQASVCVFVDSARTAQASIPVFHCYGHDIVVQ